MHLRRSPLGSSANCSVMDMLDSSPRLIPTQLSSRSRRKWSVTAVVPRIDDARPRGYGAGIMEAIAEQLEHKLHEWKPETSQKVRFLVAEIIALADDDALDIGRSRSVEQEVMDLLDDPATR